MSLAHSKWSLNDLFIIIITITIKDCLSCGKPGNEGKRSLYIYILAKLL